MNVMSWEATLILILKFHIAHYICIVNVLETALAPFTDVLYCENSFCNVKQLKTHIKNKYTTLE
jgi:hypothetical protein